MHVLEFSMWGAITVYSILYDMRLLGIFLLFIIGYYIISLILPGAANVRPRRKIMFASWGQPREGNIHNKLEIRVGHALKYLEEEYPDKKTRPSLTHLAIKALSETARVCPDINGKISFGRFVPFKNNNVSCLVDVEGGSDLAMILVEGVEKMSLEDIGDFIKSRTDKIRKTKGGDEAHQKRTGPAKFLPTFVLSITIELVRFITSILGLNFNMVGMKKDNFGFGMVTSIGMLGFTDAIAPFTPFANCTVLAAVNKVIDRPVAVNGQVKVQPTLIINFTVDHRFLDGGRAAKMGPAFERVFLKPQEFVRKNYKPELIE